MEFLKCSEVRVEGLETLDYFDNLLMRERYTEQADAITFDGDVRFYFYYNNTLSFLSLQQSTFNFFILMIL